MTLRFYAQKGTIEYAIRQAEEKNIYNVDLIVDYMLEHHSTIKEGFDHSRVVNLRRLQL